jgi:hypothetical protein
MRISPEQSAPVEMKPLEQENVPRSEHANASISRARERGKQWGRASLWAAF